MHRVHQEGSWRRNSQRTAKRRRGYGEFPSAGGRLNGQEKSLFGSLLMKGQKRAGTKGLMDWLSYCACARQAPSGARRNGPIGVRLVALWCCVPGSGVGTGGFRFGGLGEWSFVRGRMDGWTDRPGDGRRAALPGRLGPRFLEPRGRWQIGRGALAPLALFSSQSSRLLSCGSWETDGAGGGGGGRGRARTDPAPWIYGLIQGVLFPSQHTTYRG